MNAVVSQIKDLEASADEATRKTLVKTLRGLMESFETPEETLHRYGHLHLHTAAVKVGFDLGLFTYMAELGVPTTVKDISEITGADPEFIIRLLRYLSTIGAVEEVSKEIYGSNKITHNLSQKVVEAAICHYFCTVGPQYQALPSYLKQSGHENPTNEAHTPFHTAWNTSLHPFAWFSGQPDNLAYFNDYMALRRGPATSWLSVYPVQKETEGLVSLRIVYVNIGGGVGHQCAQFLEKYPHMAGKVVLQDLPHSIHNAMPTPGVENMAHDFFQPQPVKGAKFYFMRAVLHNHPPHRVCDILKNTKDAMELDSILLIDEMILPETGIDPRAAAIDMTMMTTFGSMERTEAQWRKTFEAAGLELVRAYTYSPTTHESVMDVRLPRP
jgi:hypothetical protein